MAEPSQQEQWPRLDPAYTEAELRFPRVLAKAYVKQLRISNMDEVVIPTLLKFKNLTCMQEEEVKAGWYLCSIL